MKATTIKKPSVPCFVFLAILFLGSCAKHSSTPQPDYSKFPGIGELPTIDTLPDLFTMMDGSRVSSVEQWEKRREELKALVQFYEYGFMPGDAGGVKASVLFTDTLEQPKCLYQYVRIRFEDSRLPNINLYLYIPLGPGSFPLVLRGDRCWDSMKDKCSAFLARNYIMAEFDRTDLDKDDANRLDGVHPFFPGYDWGTVAAWAWGYRRVIDYLVTCPFVDSNKIVVTGHSRGGKAALLAGALDERIALVAPNGSGAGGSGPYRCHITGEDLNAISDRFAFWFNERFLAFRDSNVNRLPFDQHAMAALVAPRAYLNTYAIDDTWANPAGTILAHEKAREVFKFLNVPGNIGIHFREGKHEQNEADWDALLSYSDHIFYGKPLPADFNIYPSIYMLKKQE